jgi:hypothetical protein
MKIQGPDQSQKTSSSRKADKAKSSGGTGSFESLLEASETEAPAHSAATGVISSVDVLLAAQGADDPAQRAARGRMRKRADDIIHQLDKVRLAMLTGSLSVGNLLDIADVVASHRERVTDPQLTSILDEIDLRAQIEIAKMRMAIEASKFL